MSVGTNRLTVQMNNGIEFYYAVIFGVVYRNKLGKETVKKRLGLLTLKSHSDNIVFDRNKWWSLSPNVL